MSQLLHLRLGRFFSAISGSSGETSAADQPWRRALEQPMSMAATLEMTARLDELAHQYCHAVEWRSASEAWLDLSTARSSQTPWAIADQLHAATKALLPVEVACGVATSKRAARAASALAAPSGLLVVLPGYEASIITLAGKHTEAADLADVGRDVAPFQPSLVPRAIVRSAAIDRPIDKSYDDTAAQYDTVIESLVSDARQGLTSLGLIAGTIRVQFSNAQGVKEAFATLAAPTALDDQLQQAAHALGRRVLSNSAGAGHLHVSLGQLISGPAQASLFGWRYHHLNAQRLRRLA